MSRKIRIATIVGARPQYIKLAPLDREFRKLAVDHLVINTGQHYDYQMAGTFFKELKLPNHTVDLKAGSGTASDMTAKILSGTATALREFSPDLVTVIGDTNSTLGGALAAIQLKLPLAHIEAGLRCFDMHTPEELNRVVTDRISNLLLCPTRKAVDNLKNEGIKAPTYLTGDLLYDVLLAMKPTKAEVGAVAKKYGLTAGEFLLVTIHRADLVDHKSNLKTLIDMLLSIKENALFPVHPRTRLRLTKFGLWNKLEKSKLIRLVEPLGYTESLAAISGSRMVLTDSGGIQREAYYLRVPTLLLRNVTEWVEINKAGGSVIVGFDAKKLQAGLKSRSFKFDDRSICRTGAAKRIADKIVAAAARR